MLLELVEFWVNQNTWHRIAVRLPCRYFGFFAVYTIIITFLVVLCQYQNNKYGKTLEKKILYALSVRMFHVKQFERFTCAEVKNKRVFTIKYALLTVMLRLMMKTAMA